MIAEMYRESNVVKLTDVCAKRWIERVMTVSIITMTGIGIFAKKNWLNIKLYFSNPQKALQCAEPRHLTY